MKIAVAGDSAGEGLARILAEHLAASHDVAEISARQGAEVTLTSVFPVDKMQANKHEIEQAKRAAEDSAAGDNGAGAH